MNKEKKEDFVREEIYTGGGITIYQVKTDRGYLTYENGDDEMILFSEEWSPEWDDLYQYMVDEYEIGSKEYMENIEKYFKDVYR